MYAWVFIFETAAIDRPISGVCVRAWHTKTSQRDLKWTKNACGRIQSIILHL